MLALKARLGALLSLLVLSLLALPALAQSVVDPANSPDLGTLINSAMQVIGDFKTGSILLGVALLANLLTNVCKIPAAADRIPKTVRPVIALLFALATTVSGALIGHLPLMPAIVAGVAAGGGSVALHEAWQSLKQFGAWARGRLSGPAHGSAHVGMLVLIAVAALLLSFAVRADAPPAPPMVQAAATPAPVKPVLPLVAASDDPTPPPAPPVTASTFGGCIKSGLVCFGPSVAVTALAINVTKGTIEGSFSPGLGYGVTAYPGQWYSIGVDIYGDVNPASQQASLAVMAKLINGYLRIGWSKGFIGDHSTRIPIGIGIDL